MMTKEAPSATNPAAPTAASAPRSSTKLSGSAIAAATPTSTPRGQAKGVLATKSCNATKYATTTPNMSVARRPSTASATRPPAAARASAASGESAPDCKRARPASSNKSRHARRRRADQSFQTSKTDNAPKHGTAPPVANACGTASTPVPTQILRRLTTIIP